MKFRSFLNLTLFLIGFTFFAQEQSGVGINTTNPRTTLEVAGDAFVDGKVLVKTIDVITQEEDVTFLIQNKDNFVKEINATGDGLAIAYFQEYILSNMEGGIGDWVQEFNTNIPSSRYVVTVISAYYNQPLKMYNDKKDNFTNPYVSAHIVDGTWRITADYPDAFNVTGTNPGVWVINTLILSRAFSKVLPAQTHNLNNANTGTAPSPAID